jgi:hypothetical protein
MISEEEFVFDFFCLGVKVRVCYQLTLVPTKASGGQCHSNNLADVGRTELCWESCAFDGGGKTPAPNAPVDLLL